MRLWSRRRRSAGVSVSAKSHQLIVAANRARDAGDWATAADRYALVLTDRPDLTHIHVQHGHALSELGRRADAERSYRAAHRADPSLRDATLHLGHILKLQGALAEAAECYASLAFDDPDDREAMRETCDLLGRLATPRSREIAGILAARIPESDPDAYQATPIEDCTIVYDVSDFLSFVGSFRRPTGIQRFQVETLTRLLAGREPVGICRFIPGRDGWVEVPLNDFRHVAAMSLAGEDGDTAAWQQARDRLLLRTLATLPFSFAPGAALVALGTSWSLPDYFLHVRNAKACSRIAYLPVVYDLIPVVMPAMFDDALVQDFMAWVTGVFDQADGFLAISQATKRDLLAIAETLDRPLDPKRVIVIPLDAVFTGSASAVPSLEGTGPIDKAQGPYVLFVATIEPRKGHLVAFDAWSRLVDRLGATPVPRLVCVGRDGWRNQAIFDRLAHDPALAGKVTFLSGISDDRLASLYRGCLFAIYPSLYEGWGLPVTEALCYGKAVITTTASSLPEAGGSHARYVPPNDAGALADEAEALIVDDAAREALERRIAADFRPRRWTAVAAQIGDAIVDLRREADGTADRFLPHLAHRGRFYWLNRSGAMALRRQPDAGEPFRHGLGWHPAEPNGCRIRQGGAELAARLADVPADGATTVRLRLVGSPFGEVGFRVEGGLEPLEGTLSRDERRTLAIATKVAEDKSLRLVVVDMTGQPLVDSEPSGIDPGLVVEGFAVG